MPTFNFSLPLEGTANYEVQAETLEEACKLLANADEAEGYNNQYLVESDVGIDLPYGLEPVHEKLMHLVD